MSDFKIELPALTKTHALKEKKDECRKSRNSSSSDGAPHAYKVSPDKKNISKRPPKLRDSLQLLEKPHRRTHRLQKPPSPARASSQEDPSSALFANLDLDKTIREKLITIAGKTKTTDRLDEDYAELWKRLEKVSFNPVPNFNSKIEDSCRSEKPQSLEAAHPKRSFHPYNLLETGLLSSFYAPAPKKQLQLIVCPEELMKDSFRYKLAHRNPVFAVFEISENPRLDCKTHTLEFCSQKASADVQLTSSLALIDENKYWPRDFVQVKVPPLVLRHFEEMSRWQANLFYRRQVSHQSEFRSINKLQTSARTVKYYSLDEELKMLNKTYEEISILENHAINEFK